MKLPFQRTSSTATAFSPTCTEFPPLDGAEISAMVHGSRVGGDFYHFMRTTPQRVVFGLLDVAGQRTENQHIIAATRTAFQEAARARFGDVDVNEADAMMEFCMDLNAAIRRSASAVCVCAAFIGCYSEDFGTICYVNAGHTPGLLRQATKWRNCARLAFRWDYLQLPLTRRPRRFLPLAARCSGFTRSCRGHAAQGRIRPSSGERTLRRHSRWKVPT